MRLTTVILIATFLQVSANGFAQKITLSKRNAPLKTIFKELRNQSGYVFLCTENQLKISNPVNINVNGEDFQDVLKQIFENQPLTYNINEKTITIKEKERSIIDYFSNIDVSGKVVDENGQPIAGATIKVKGTTLTTVSDGNGIFILKNIADDALVEISYLGYQTKEVKASKDLGSLKMDLAVGKLEEVTINAGYYTVKQQELTGSISRITSKDIQNQPVANALATMQGRMAGVAITQTTGVPGGSFDIKIRGQNSLRSGNSTANNPLYVIDGVPYSSDPIGTGSNSAVLPTQPNPLNSINPNQIESIEVLKDADATAIYGSRGSNGVVLITTKKGKTGKTEFSSKLSTGLSNVTRFMKLMNTDQYVQMRKEAYSNDGITVIPSFAYDVNGIWDQNRSTDWQKELLGNTSHYTDIQTSLSGGSQQTQFLFGGNFNRQTSVFPGQSRYKKGNFNLNVNHQSLDKKFNSMIIVGYTLQDNNQPRLDLMRETMSIAPNSPSLYNLDGTLNWENNTFNNPLRNRDGKYKALTNDLIGNAILSYKIIDGLEIRSNFGYTVLKNREITTNPSTRYNPSSGLGSEYSTLIVGDFDRKSWIIEPQLNWTKAIGKGILSILVGATFQSQSSSQFVQYGSGFSSNSLIFNIASSSSVSILSSDELQYKYQAFFGRVNYNFQSKYIINLTGRRDGSSRFGPGNQFANFGAVGAAWLFAKENFLKNNTILSSGKLRGSYGITGSDQIGDYQFLNTYSNAGVKYGAVSGLRPSRLFNPDFAWENNKKMEIAFEIGLFKDRLFFTSSYYDNRSSNQLTGIPLPGTTGFTSLQSNLNATVQNKGVELTLNSINFQNKDFNWTSNLNLTVARTRLIEFPNLATSTYANTYVIGQPLNIRKVYQYVNVDPQKGIYTFADVNKDGLLTALEDKQTIMDLTPKYFGGLQNTIRYKKLQLDFLFQFVKQINYNASSYFPLAGTQGNQPVAVLDRWQKPGDIAQHQVYTTGSNSAATTAYYNYFESSGAFGDASYIRLKTVALSYPIQFKKVKANVFFEGQNLLTFTKFDGADPEFNSLGYLPPLKTFSTGIQFNL